MYSTDRSDALSHTISCLKYMKLYDKCQKTLVVDGKIDRIPSDWQAIQIPRNSNGFCWGRMWDAGVYSARYEKIVYLDSDRLMPENYLNIVNEKIDDDVFIFTSKHFLMLEALPIQTCKDLLKMPEIETSLIMPNYIGRFKYEVRHQFPFHGPGKNVMSGSVAFNKKTYNKLGGVDHWYCGHGAFADSDFHMQASVAGCNFIDLEIPELHYPHKKIDNNTILNEKKLYYMGLDNFIYYCKKWNLPMKLADGLAERCGESRPSKYVDNRLKEIMAISKEF